MRFTKAVVAGVRGMIILPDDWNASTYPLNAVNEHREYNCNQILGSEWLEVLKIKSFKLGELGEIGKK